ncbi:Uncharacterised protein [Lysinibacillus sphaericus]|nr:Uncharacterised protein [Lysinibacillus sphaericus]
MAACVRRKSKTIPNSVRIARCVGGDSNIKDYNRGLSLDVQTFEKLLFSFLG